MIPCRHCEAELLQESKYCPFCGSPLYRADTREGSIFAGKYHLQSKIARGGYGAVYKAIIEASQEQVAVKILHAEINDPENRERFRREVTALSRLTHPSATKIYDHGETMAGSPWIAMEFLEGTSLHQLLHQKPLSQQNLLGILWPICEVLLEAHLKGILHRDLKADHIILIRQQDESILPKLIDFGLASLLDAETLTQSGVIAGTPQYMAPEQWDGLRNTDARTDVYALGTIAYQALAGRLPFEASNAPEWMQKHCYEEPLDLAIAAQGRGVSSLLSNVINKAISKKKEDRQQSMMEFQREVFSIDFEAE
jgi:serine/threonine protein kinase